MKPTVSALVIARKRISIHPWLVRTTHWVNTATIVVMTLSGWRIYNASPLFDFTFPTQFTIGGWLAGALQWHFAVMWLLIGNICVYLIYGTISGHFRNTLLPITRMQLCAEVRQAMSFRLKHEPGTYNTLQRTAYVSAIFLILLLILSGLALWKPVQLQALTWVMSGYEGARRVHFFAMCLLIAFIAIHIVMAMTAPKRLLSMSIGKATVPEKDTQRPAHVDIPHTEAGDAL